MRLVVLAAGLALATASAAAAQPAATTAPAAAAAYTTATTDIGTLLDDPTAKAVLVKHIPDVANSDQVDMVRSMTLKDVQGLAPDKVTDQALADIDADLAKLPPKK
jgi:para-nitrobenzyl esterase